MEDTFGVTPVKLANEHLLNGIEYYEAFMDWLEQDDV